MLSRKRFLSFLLTATLTASVWIGFGLWENQFFQPMRETVNAAPAMTEEEAVEIATTAISLTEPTPNQT